MIKKILGLVAVVALSGCAVNYTFEGQKYDSKEKFHQAVDGHVIRTLATITPLPKPLTQKKLIFAMPSETTLIDESKKRFAKTQSSAPTGPALEILENIPKSTYKNIKIYFDAIQKRNLYASVQFIDMQSMTGSFAASADTDTLYMIEPTAGSNQWYYSSLKQGKQIFAYDRSSPTAEGKVQAFVDAVQVQAIRE
jgi:hypothetical protein